MLKLSHILHHQSWSTFHFEYLLPNLEPFYGELTNMQSQIHLTYVEIVSVALAIIQFQLLHPQFPDVFLLASFGIILVHENLLAKIVFLQKDLKSLMIL